MEGKQKSRKENEDRVAEEYLSSLTDLNCNSKPLINMLTMLAEENIEYAPVIVKVVEHHIAKVPPDFKLPILYLIDSIVKNVKGTYVQLFSQCIVNIFCGVFEKVNEKVRERMYALRQTWNDVFTPPKLYALDIKVKDLDNNWPITAKPSIHVNPNFLKSVNVTQAIPSDVEEILHAKTRELLELKKRKLELELEATKKHLEAQEKQLSKTTETVIAPVDSLIAAAPGTAPTSNIQVPGQQQIQMTGANDTRSRAFHQVRNYAASHNITGKHKVNPVNAALLNTVRPRDPRLARQQQMLQTNMGSAENVNSKIFTSSSNKSNRSSEPRSSSERDTKTHLRHVTNTSSSSRATGSSKNNSSSNRGKNKERKRSESKTSTTSYSSNGSSSSSDRRRQHSSTSSNRDKESGSKYDKDAFEIAPLSAIKRKSSSPAGSPTNSKDSRPPSKLRISHNKNRSHSRSPIHDGISNKDGTYGAMATTSLTEGNKAVHSPKDFDKNLKTFSESERVNPRQDVDLRQSLFLSPSLELSQSVREESSAKPVSTTKSSPKVSFKVQKLFNKIAKSTVHLSTASATDNFATNSGSSNKISTHDAGKKSSGAELHNFNANDDRKRQIMQITEDTEPLSKKSKVAKIDALFGTEDVDLRTLMPTQILANSNTAMLFEEPKVNQNIENFDHMMVDAAPLSTTGVHVKTSPKKKSNNFEDVRAKLAKAAKYNNKFNKIDKINKELSQRFKLAELNFNEDTQEANDEKVRTILAQAQELLESNSINQEQYKHLVQHLEAGRRREMAMNCQKEKPLELEEENDVDLERIAARDAVLKKRIPKIIKTQQQLASLDERKLIENTPSGGSNSPFYEDKCGETADEVAAVKLKFNNSNPKEKRQKMTKWNERGDKSNAGATNVNNNDVQSVQRAQWVSGSVSNRRPAGNFRNHPTMPTSAHATMPPQMPWNMNGPGAAGAMHTTMPFNNQQLTRVNMPSSQLQNATSTGSMLSSKPGNSIDNPQADLVRTITIDGLAKEIRIYDQTSIVFMDQPREIGFQDGKRSIIIDNNEPIALHFNDKYKSFIINGISHSLRFGFPSRELYIDDNWYEIYFGGPPVPIPLQNKICLLKAEGPPPQVNIGAIRHDLVVGKLNMIIDAHTIVPVFLDAKLQKFRLGNEEHTIQFADNLLTLLLDGEPRQVEYGGLPKSFAIGSKKYFVRFTALPAGIVAGKVKIKDMRWVKTEPIIDVDMTIKNEMSEVSTIAQTTNPKTADNSNRMNIASSASDATIEQTMPSSAPVNALNAVSALGNLNIDELFKKLVSSGILSTPAASASAVSAEVATNEDKEKSSSVNAEPVVEKDVFKPEARRPIDLSKLETIKTRQSSIVDVIFHGMQCSSCGVRFPPEQTIKYSQHLDWHFRQNRRERDLLRKSNSRKWYYELNDWLQYEEVEDTEDREKNFFETQQNEMDTNDEGSNQRPLNSPMISCPACPEDVDRACDMCHEKFEQFYNEEMEEWHLRSALRVDEKIYHPLCFEDYKASLKVQKEKDEEIAKTDVPTTEEDHANVSDVQIKTEENNETDNETQSHVTYVDDDDDVIVLPNEDPSITEIVDDDDDDEFIPPSETATDSKEQECADKKKAPTAAADAMESDVEIQEPHIPFTDLDTYEESQHAEDVSNLDLLNIKIKEEPKDDDEKDEDDGFEDVGTIVIGPDEEISVHSEDTQNTKTAADAPDEAPLLTSAIETDSGETVKSTPADVNISMEGNLVSEGEHNLSTAGPAPAVPLASLVNKIKINITKNTVNSNSSASATTTTIPTSKTNTELNTCNVSQITVVSTIPVLCGGGTTTSSSVLIPVSTVNNNMQQNKETYTSNSSVSSNVDTSVSSISVIGGSYGGAPSTSSKPPLSKPKMSFEDTIVYEQKPLLKNAKLQQVKKIQAGVETSGLCSIM